MFDSLDELGKFKTLEMLIRERRLAQIERTLLDGETGLRFLQPSPELRELVLLIEIGKNANISQSTLAEKANLAPSMVNNYMKNFVDEGLVEMRGATRRKVTYELTKKGVKRRGELLSAYMGEMLRLYKNARTEFSSRVAKFYDEGLHRVVLYGAGEIALLLITAAKEIGIEIVGVVDSDPRRQGERIGNMVIHPPTKIKEMNPDGVIITSLAHREEIHNAIRHLEKDGIKIREF
jgi:DNA-binding MarR family transcriptional regulator